MNAAAAASTAAASNIGNTLDFFTFSLPRRRKMDEWFPRQVPQYAVYDQDRGQRDRRPDRYGRGLFARNQPSEKIKKRKAQKGQYHDGKPVIGKCRAESAVKQMVQRPCHAAARAVQPGKPAERTRKARAVDAGLYMVQINNARKQQRGKRRRRGKSETPVL